MQMHRQYTLKHRVSNSKQTGLVKGLSARMLVFLHLNNALKEHLVCITIFSVRSLYFQDLRVNVQILHQGKRQLSYLPCCSHLESFINCLCLRSLKSGSRTSATLCSTAIQIQQDNASEMVVHRSGSPR